MSEATGLEQNKANDQRQQIVSDLCNLSVVCSYLSEYGFGYKAEILPHGIEIVGWSDPEDNKNNIRKISQIISWESVRDSYDLFVEYQSVIAKITNDLGDTEGYQKIQDMGL